MAMTYSYDDDGDILYVQFSNGKVDKTNCLDDLRNVDIGKNGVPVGVEFIGASGGLDLTDVPNADKIAALIAAEKLGFPILVP